MDTIISDDALRFKVPRRDAYGKFAWPRDLTGTLTLTHAQLDALVLGLPWQRIGEAGVITLQ